MHNNYIPYIVGVTGHRDIRSDSLDFLKKELHQYFTELKKSLADTPIYLFSPLAEGADRITAQIALTHGVSLIVPLPLEQKEYLKDFKDEASKQEFELLIKQSSQTYFVGYSDNNSAENISNRSLQYQKVGEHIADRCNTLLAVWDQKVIEKTGGTSQIVSYKRKGVYNNIFDGQDGNLIQVIPVLRNNSDKELMADLKTPCAEILGHDIEAKEKHFEHLNALNKINAILKKNTDVSSEFDNGYEKMSNHFSDIASNFQSCFKKSIITLVVLSWIAVLSLELLHNFHIMSAMFSYVFVILGAFGYFYIKISKQKNQDYFVIFRGLSEALRVQNRWYQAGIDKCVSEFYLKRHYSGVAWMKIALKNIYTLNTYILMQTQTPDIEQVKHDWIKNQLDYYKNAILVRQNKYQKLIKIEHLFYKSGMFFSALTFLLFLCEYFHLSTGLSVDQLKLIFHIALFSSGMFLVTAAFIGEKYLHITAYKEDITNFEIMQAVFQKSEKLFACKEIDPRHILLELGKEALYENSYWVILHSDRKLSKPTME